MSKQQFRLQSLKGRKPSFVSYMTEKVNRKYKTAEAATVKVQKLTIKKLIIPCGSNQTCLSTEGAKKVNRTYDVLLLSWLLFMCMTFGPDALYRVSRLPHCWFHDWSIPKFWRSSASIFLVLQILSGSVGRCSHTTLWWSVRCRCSVLVPWAQTGLVCLRAYVLNKVQWSTSVFRQVDIMFLCRHLFMLHFQLVRLTLVNIGK